MIKFGTGGFRGIIADDFNKRNIKLIAQGLSNLVKERQQIDKPIYIGYDYRFASDSAARWLSETLAANGVKVILSQEATPTPVIMYACKKNNAYYGLMVTASHNPANFNGVKLFQSEGMDAEVELTNCLENKINLLLKFKSMDFEKALTEGKIQIESFLDGYLDNIMHFLRPDVNFGSLHVLFDFIYGTGSVTIKRLCEMQKIHKPLYIQDTHDALFGNLVPNPTLQNMQLDRKMLLEKHCDLAIGTDSDCDRIGILDELGNYVSANEIMAVIYYYLIKYRGQKGDIVKNTATSILIDKLANKLAFRSHEVDVGFKNISAGIKEYDALLGGESSGGLTMRGYLFGKDSTFATALFLEAISVIQKPVSQIVAEVKAFADYNYYLLEDSIACHDKNGLMYYLHHHQPELDAKIIDTRLFGNNCKYLFADGSWILIRFSGTEPVIRLFVEMPSIEQAQKICSNLKFFVEQAERVRV